MPQADRCLILGTRGSALALVQAQAVADALERLGWQVIVSIIKTTGDRVIDRPLDNVGSKGLFVKELEEELLAGHIDLAVHSMKDMPGEMPAGLTIGAVPPREDARDVLISRDGGMLADLRPRAVIGTCSPRRRAQLLAARGDVQVEDIRGNLDTRLRKLDGGACDALCLAAAGLHRLGWRERISEYFDPSLLVPAVGQGALAVQVRAGDERVLAAVHPLHDEASWAAVRAERTVLAELGGGCTVPLGALAEIRAGQLTLRAFLSSPDGRTILREELTGAVPEEIGRDVAQRLLDRGGRALLDDSGRCD